MKVLKNELGRLRELTVIHFVLAVLGALLMSGYAVTRPPLDRMTLSPGEWIPIFLPPFVTVFLFYALMRKPVRSVFWFVKWLYFIGAPLLLTLAAELIVRMNSTSFYAVSPVTRFLPIWAAVWWLGTAALYALMRVLENAAPKGLEKGVLGARVAYALAVMYTPQKTISKRGREGKSKWFAAGVCMALVALAVFIGTVTAFLHAVYSNMEFEAILFTMRFAAGGLAIEDIISGTAIFLIFAVITAYLCYHLIRSFCNDELVVSDTNKTGKYTLVMNDRKRTVNIILSAALLAGSVAVFSRQTGFMHYLEIKQNRSTVYDSYYVAPDESVVSFPGEKRNLIFIYIESMENTYASEEEGGILDRNYISELTELTKAPDGVSFSNTDKLGGASVFVPSITYTMGSTVAQTSGIALNTQLLGETEYPSMIRLEDILHDNGYDQLYIEGSKGEFSMYDKYVGRYENSKVFDRITAAEQGYIDESADYMWKWGIEDSKLFELTKGFITEMSQNENPFFVTMYTMDTHSFETGHRCKYCDSSITSDYLAAVDCTSRQVAEFVDWVRQQPFYENTTVILVGDHLGNEKTTKTDITDGYIRTTYNCFINAAKEPVNTKNRLFSSLDMFPSTLSAIGAEIKGDRLGLGTDLFSGTKTLCEELGEEEYKAELERSSEYYDKIFCGL